MPDGTKTPIAHASRTLLPDEKHYSHIEKKSLGIIFAVTKFHRYLYGRFLTLQTDHKPLITISGSKNGLLINTAIKAIKRRSGKVPEVLSLCDSVLLYSERTVIPKKLQNRILRDFQTGHPEIDRMKSLMKSCLLAEDG